MDFNIKDFISPRNNDNISEWEGELLIPEDNYLYKSKNDSTNSDKNKSYTKFKVTFEKFSLKNLDNETH